MVLTTAISCLWILAAPNVVTWTDLAEPFGVAGTATDPGTGIGGGVAPLDIDGDGRLDLVIASPVDGVRVLRQTSAGWAVDPNALPALPFAQETAGVTTLDMDDDGDDDLLVIRNGSERLLRNDGGVFTDVSDTHLPDDGYWSVSAAVGDVDGDGDDDVYVGNYISGQLFPSHFGSPNRLLLNDGHGRFTDVAAAAGLEASPFGCTLSVMAIDIDDDGDLDLVDANDFGAFSPPNALWRNEGVGADGLPHFVDASEATGFRDHLYGMGLAAADIDGDERPDLVVTSIGRGVVRQSSTSGFQDVTEAIGASVTWADDGFQVTWTPLLLDLDGDGLVDLFETGGHVHAAPFISNGNVVRNVTFRGRPGGAFRLDPDDLILPSHPENNARGVAVADVDGDGLPELAIAHSTGLFSLLHAPTAVPRPLALVPHPTETGPSATGLSVRAACATATHRFFLVGGGNFGSAHERAVWVTLPNCPTGSPVSLVVVWPSGLTTTHVAPMGSRIDLTEPNWLEPAPDALRFRPVDGLGAAITSPDRVALSATSGAVGSITMDADGWFHAPVTGATPEAVLTLTVDGHALPVHPRLPSEGSPPVILTQPRHLIEGRSARVVVVFPGKAPSNAIVDVGGIPIATEPTADPAVRRSALPFTPGSSLTEGEVTVEVRVGGAAVASRVIAVEGPFEPSVSRIRIGARLWLAGVAPPALGVVVSLRDANGYYPAMDSLSYVLRVDGQAVAPSGLSTNTSQALVSFPVDPIPDGASLGVVVADHPIGKLQPFQRITSADGLVTEVDPARSTCGPSMTTALADGHDRVTMLIFLRDAYGNPIPSIGPPPTVASALGVTIDSASDWSADDRHQVVVTTGTTPGDLALPVSLGGEPTGLNCRLRLLTPPPNPVGLDATTSELIVLPRRLPVSSTAQAEVHLRPRNAAGRLLGSGLSPTVTTTIGTVTPLTYAGLGRYDATFTPGDLLGFGDLTAALGPSSVSVPVEIFDPAAIPFLDVASADAGFPDVSAPDAGVMDGLADDTVAPATDLVDASEPLDAESADDATGDTSASDTGSDDSWSGDTGTGLDTGWNPEDVGTNADAGATMDAPTMDAQGGWDTLTSAEAASDTTAAPEHAPDVGPHADTLPTRGTDVSPDSGGCMIGRRGEFTGFGYAVASIVAAAWARRRARRVC